MIGSFAETPISTPCPAATPTRISPLLVSTGSPATLPRWMLVSNVGVNAALVGDETAQFYPLPAGGSIAWGDGDVPANPLWAISAAGTTIVVWRGVVPT